jgi:hypothetical protein
VISSGLSKALAASGATPRIIGRAHPAARIAALWRGGTPILTRGDLIWWPGAPRDLSGSPATAAVLQHELQHVLDYRTGWLTAWRYLSHPRHWRYDLALGRASAWRTLGAEQRARAAELLWLAENGLGPRTELPVLRGLIPWAGTPLDP